MSNLTTYELMYDIVNSMQPQTGETLLFKKSTFIACCQREPGVADMSNADQLEDIEFLEFIYAVCLNRLIDKRALDYWSNEVARHPKTYRKKLIFRILTSSEFIDLGKKISNNPYEIRFLNQKKAFFIAWNRVVSSLATFLKTNIKLRNYWHLIPNDIRERIVYAVYK